MRIRCLHTFDDVGQSAFPVEVAQEKKLWEGGECDLLAKAQD